MRWFAYAEEPDFLVGNVDRYTIVIWMEGDDPECVDSIIGGSVQFSMRIDADYDDETNLVWKFVKDIKDTLSGDKPINASCNGRPNDSYYSDKECLEHQAQQVICDMRHNHCLYKSIHFNKLFRKSQIFQ